MTHHRTMTLKTVINNADTGFMTSLLIDSPDTAKDWLSHSPPRTTPTLTGLLGRRRRRRGGEGSVEQRKSCFHVDGSLEVGRNQTWSAPD